MKKSMLLPDCNPARSVLLPWRKYQGPAALTSRESAEQSSPGRETIFENHKSASTKFHAHVFTPPRRRAPLHRNFTKHDASSSKATESQQGTRNHHEKQKPITVNSSQATKLPKTKIQNQKSKQTTPSRGTTPRQREDRRTRQKRPQKQKRKEKQEMKMPSD